MATHADIRMELRSEPRLLRTARAMVQSYVSEWGLGKDRIADAVLAVDEACTNAIRHSYEGRTNEWITLTMRATPTHIEIELCDAGCPIPAECVKRKELETPQLDTLKAGGLGVQLIYQAFDEVEFIPGEHHGNRLIMRLNRPEL